MISATMITYEGCIVMWEGSPRTPRNFSSESCVLCPLSRKEGHNPSANRSPISLRIFVERSKFFTATIISILTCSDSLGEPIQLNLTGFLGRIIKIMGLMVYITLACGRAVSKASFILSPGGYFFLSIRALGYNGETYPFSLMLRQLFSVEPIYLLYPSLPR